MKPLDILIKLRNSDKKLFDVPVSVQNDMLLHLGPASNDFERSYKQFRGRHLFYHKWKEVIVEIGSFFVLPFYIIYGLVEFLFNRKPIDKKDAVGDFTKFEEIIPQSLRNEFSIDNTVWGGGRMLSFSDIGIIWKLFTLYPIPCLVLKNAIKLSYYRYVINKYKPRAIIVHNEASYTSSISTLLCERNGVQHINVMHGEKIFYIGDGYFRFTRCYVWNEYYKNLFIEMNAEANQFIVEVPPSFKIDSKKYYREDAFADFKYYLQNFTEEEIKNIIDSLAFVKRLGKTIKFRPHPRGHNLELLKKYVKETDIEYPSEVSILESISSMDCAVGSFSTVMNQAYYSGKKVIFDDVNYPEIYKKLKEYKYYFSNTPHNTLSTFVHDDLEHCHEVVLY